MTLDEAIELEWCLNIEAIATKNQAQIELAKQMHEWLLELRDRRETELRPANKFLNNTPIKQLTHVLSEIKEIQDVMIQLKQPKSDSDWQQLQSNLADEIYDAQSSLVTLAYICGLNRDDMIAAGKRKIKANGDRGYYQEVNDG